MKHNTPQYKSYIKDVKEHGMKVIALAGKLELKHFEISFIEENIGDSVFELKGSVADRHHFLANEIEEMQEELDSLLENAPSFELRF